MKPDHSSIKEKTASGVFWVSISSASTLIINFLSRIILARILLPWDYGIFALGTLIITILGVIRDIGLGFAIIQRKENLKESLDTAFVITLITAVFLFLICNIAAPFLSLFYNEKDLLPVIRILSITLLFNPFILIPISMMNKEMEFKKLFVPELLANFAFIASAVILALTGQRFWSLVWASVISAVVYLIVCNLAYPWKPSFKFNKTVASELLKYGASTSGVGIIALILTQGDNAVAGKVLGSTLLGYYLMAYTFSNLPATVIARLSNKISIPLLAKFQDYPEELKRVFLKIFKVNMFLITLVATIIFISAEKLTMVLLGTKWLPIVFPMKILCAAGFSRALTSICAAFLWATGTPQIDLKIMSGALMFFLLAIYPFTKFLSLQGTAVAVSITFSITGVLDLYFAIKKSGISWKEVTLFFIKLFTVFIVTLMLTSLFDKLVALSLSFSLLFSVIIILAFSTALTYLMDKETILFMNSYLLRRGGNKE